MFERYTEKARRVIFFARYEASHYGSTTIEPEHLLLGLIRELKTLRKWVPNASGDSIRQSLDAQIPKRPSISTSVDLPLSEASKMVLKAAGDIADQLTHRYIGTEHLLFGLLAVPDSLVTQLLTRGGADSAFIRVELAKQLTHRTIQHFQNPTRAPRHAFSDNIVQIHGTPRNADYVRDVVSTVRSYNYHWEKLRWRNRDIVIHQKNGAFSFELSLAEDTSNFILVKQGWKKDHCFICRWELLESEDEHGIGYTNGRSWLCVECCERFVLGDFFSSSYSDIT